MADGNGANKANWFLLVAVGSLALTVLHGVFSAGGTDKATDIRLTSLEIQMADVPKEYVRKDVVELRFLTLEQTQKRLEDQAQIQSDTLERILQHERR